MVQVMMNDVDSRAELVLTMRPPDVVGGGETPVIAECRVPSFGVANIGKTGDAEHRESAAAQIRRIVGAGDAEHVRADVSAEVRRLPILTHACETDIAVHHERGRERQRVPHGD